MPPPGTIAAKAVGFQLETQNLAGDAKLTNLYECGE